MRAVVAAMLVAWTTSIASADQTDPRLAGLFARLQDAPDAAAAEPVEAEIWRIWSRTGDEDDDALLQRGTAAMNAGDARTARAALDLLVERAPECAEAWNKRATLLYLTGDDAGSIADIRRTLSLEPRHFGALSGLALIYGRQDRPDEALRSLEAALAVHPHLRGGRARAEELRAQSAGDPT
jgi:tetratricopeptide (TPR) repeat protein